MAIGGGAAGMMAALSAREAGVPVTLLERNPKLGRKLYITGKGRCNLTNLSSPAQVLENVVRNPRFLYSCVSAFPPQSVMDWFESHGVPLKVERGGRVFPVSDRAADVIDALFLALRRTGVSLVEDRAAALELEDGHLTAVRGENGLYPAGAAVIATGGLSYPATGSTGDGYRLAQSAGHTVTPLSGSLVPLEAEGCAAMQGLSLKNVALTVKNSRKKSVFSQQGELLFTHFGLSGPLILSASAHLRDFARERYTAHIDLKPAHPGAAGLPPPPGRQGLGQPGYGELRPYPGPPTHGPCSVGARGHRSSSQGQLPPQGRPPGTGGGLEGLFFPHPRPPERSRGHRHRRRRFCRRGGSKNHVLQAV